jgi:hypothetical protein
MTLTPCAVFALKKDGVIREAKPKLRVTAATG